MHSSTRVTALAVPVLLALLSPFPASAVSPARVFLGVNGNDANDCANPATPCNSFAGALAQVATGGEVIIGATGGYGPLSVTKSVSIHAAPGVVAFSGSTVTVNAPGGIVVLRGLTVDGSGVATGNGIDVQAVSALHVESCVITGFGNGILVSSDGQLFVKDTSIRDLGAMGSGFGIWIKPLTGTSKASIDHCRIETSQFGVVCNPNAVATVRDSVLSGHANTAAEAAGGATAELNIEACTVTNSNYGIGADSGTVRVSRTTVTDNATAMYAINGGLLLSRSNNTVEGNGTNGNFTGTYAAK